MKELEKARLSINDQNSSNPIPSLLETMRLISITIWYTYFKTIYIHITHARWCLMYAPYVSVNDKYEIKLYEFILVHFNDFSRWIPNCILSLFMKNNYLLKTNKPHLQFVIWKINCLFFMRNWMCDSVLIAKRLSNEIK